MLDIFEKAINKAVGVKFAELRAVDNWSNSISLTDKELHEVKSGSTFTFGVRVLKDKSWGFASSNNIEDLDNAVKKAIKLAKASSRAPINAKLADRPAYRKEVEQKVKVHPSDVALDDKIKTCKELAAYGFIDSRITSNETRYLDTVASEYYVSTDGSAIHTKNVRSLYAFDTFAKDKLLVNASDRAAGLSGVEILNGKEKLVESVAKQALKLLKSELPPSGKLPVVIDPLMTGVFAHEIVGHALEGDTVLAGKSILANKMDERIGSSNITIWDDATRKKEFGTYFFDAEGTKASKTLLIENGRVRNFLHSRETAIKSGDEPTGNARAQTCNDFPIVRMSNIIVDPGDYSKQELFEGIKYGVYVHGMKGGVTDPTSGSFQFAAEYGYLIENGHLTKPLRDVTLVGNILETLRKVNAIGKKTRYGNSGMCGKAGQYVSVSDGGPHLRISEILVGG